MKINNNNLAKLAINKSLLKEYSNSNNDRIVYMDNDTEFQIQIFNPYNYIIGVSFSFNNQNESNTLLVLKPGERIWLDRYLNNESKLKFSTYEVSNSKAVKEAIKDNGNLCIKFYKECDYTPSSTYTYNYWDNNINVTPKSSGWKPIDVWYTNTCDYNNNVNTAVNSLVDYCVSDANSASFCSSVTTCSAEINGGVTASAASTRGLSAKSKSIETGRIEKGSHSNQKFTNVYNDFESWPFKTEYIKIMPSSTKPISSNDLQKRYCVNCGRKIKPTFKFCPFCGANQE